MKLIMLGQRPIISFVNHRMSPFVGRKMGVPESRGLLGQNYLISGTGCSGYPHYCIYGIYYVSGNGRSSLQVLIYLSLLVAL